MTGRQLFQNTPLPVVEKLLLRWLYRRAKNIDGVWLAGCRELTLQKAIDALKLIKTYDPIRYKRLAKDLEYICVGPSVTNDLAYFDSRLRACVLNEEFVEKDDSSPEFIASAIVHEATHARLDQNGIRYDEALRSRVEAVCFRRELAFAAKLPNGDVVQGQAERSLAFYADPGYWTNTAIVHRYFAEGAEALRRFGVPEWLVRIVLALAALVRRFRRWRQSGQMAGPESLR